MPEEDVRAAEARLGLRLPRLLRELYLRTGRRDDIHRCHNRLLRPEEIKTDDNALVFYEENQAVVLWAIERGAFGLGDPPVVGADNKTVRDWEGDQERLSTFLLIMLLLQASLGGMRYGGVGGCDVRAAAPGDEWQRCHFGSYGSAFLREGQILYVHSPSIQVGTSMVSGGGRTKAEFLALTQAFAVDWNYSTLDDEEEEQEGADDNE